MRNPSKKKEKNKTRQVIQYNTTKAVIKRKPISKTSSQLYKIKDKGKCLDEGSVEAHNEAKNLAF